LEHLCIAVGVWLCICASVPRCGSGSKHVLSSHLYCVHAGVLPSVCVCICVCVCVFVLIVARLSARTLSYLPLPLCLPLPFKSIALSHSFAVPPLPIPLSPMLLSPFPSPALTGKAIWSWMTSPPSSHVRCKTGRHKNESTCPSMSVVIVNRFKKFASQTLHKEKQNLGALPLFHLFTMYFFPLHESGSGKDVLSTYHKP